MKRKNTYIQTKGGKNEKFVEVFKSKAGNAGFTLIELLVMVSTSSVLIGLLVPAIQK